MSQPSSASRRSPDARPRIVVIERPARDDAGHPPLLLLHGLGSSARDWSPQLERFSAVHAVTAPDLRNHGDSSKGHRELELSHHAADVIALMDASGIERAHVVGLSMGGCIGLQLALDHPRRFASLTIVNAAADMRPRGWQARLLMAVRYPLFHLFGMRRLGEKQAEQLFPDPADHEAKQIATESWNRVSRRDFLRQLDAVLKWRVDRRLDEIDLPVLVVASRDDFTPVALKRQLADTLPRGRLAIVDGHHVAPLEKPASFDAALQAFLDDLG